MQQVSGTWGTRLRRIRRVLIIMGVVALLGGCAYLWGNELHADSSQPAVRAEGDALVPLEFVGTERGYTGPEAIGAGWVVLEFSNEGSKDSEVLLIPVRQQLSEGGIDDSFAQGLPDLVEAPAQLILASGEKTTRQLWLEPGLYLVLQRVPAFAIENPGERLGTLHRFTVAAMPSPPP
jgi:hypothetical protein